MHSMMQVSVETRALADRLARVPIGDTINFSELSAALGSNVIVRRYLLLSAIRIVNSETGAIFASVRTVGYKRLEAQDAHMLGASTRRRIRGAAKRAESKITRALATANEMPDEARRKGYAEISTLALLRHVATDKSAKEAATEDAKPMPVAKTMRAMMKAIGADVAP